MDYELSFPLWQVCGLWESRMNSPPIRIYRSGKIYRIALAYSSGTALVSTLYSRFGKMWARLPEWIQIAYDRENDLLVLASEGTYHRSGEEEPIIINKIIRI